MTSYGSVMLHNNKPLLLLLLLLLLLSLLLLLLKDIRLAKAKQLAFDFQLVSQSVSQSVCLSYSVGKILGGQ